MSPIRGLACLSAFGGPYWQSHLILLAIVVKIFSMYKNKKTNILSQYRYAYLTFNLFKGLYFDRHFSIRLFNNFEKLLAKYSESVTHKVSDSPPLLLTLIELSNFDGLWKEKRKDLS